MTGESDSRRAGVGDTVFSITVIIPAVNEETTIAAAVASAATAGVEVIVADGGSRDATRERASAVGARVVGSLPGKGRQMNAAAREARGEALLFLHADTVLPQGWVGQVGRILRGGAVAGAFRLGIMEEGFRPRLVEAGANFRSRWLGLPWGDQAIFLRASLFRELGGFPEIEIMEDVALVRRLRRRGRIVLAEAVVSTSPRRWRGMGYLRATLVNQTLLALFLAGVDPCRLAGWYRGGAGDRRQSAQRPSWGESEVTK